MNGRDASALGLLHTPLHLSSPHLRLSIPRNNSMPPRSTRKRRAVDLSDVEDEVDVPTPTQTQREQRREFTPEDDYDDEDDDDDAEEDIHNGAGSLAQLSKSLVRYALACEYSRTPLKRADINQKVIALHKTVKFKEVFDAANSQLMDTFGMVMVELPNREKVTTKQKRGMHVPPPRAPSH